MSSIMLHNKDLAKIVDSSTRRSIFFNKTTGEVQFEVPEEPLPKVRYRKVVGVDTKWLQDCITVDDYEEVLKALDKRVDGKPSINKSFMLEMVMKGKLTNKELILLHHLFTYLVGHNIVVGNVRELREAEGLSSQHFSTMMKQLEKKRVVSVVRKDRPYRGDYVIRIAPHLVWDGDYKIREVKINLWNNAGVEVRSS